MPLLDTSSSHRLVTGIFFWGGKVIFPDFFPGMKCFFLVENSHFGRPKTNCCHFQKWKAKKKKKKRSSPLFSFFSAYNNFPSFLLNFHPFSLFSLPLFSQYISKNFPVRSLRGTLPPPLHHCHHTVHIISHPIVYPIIKTPLEHRGGLIKSNYPRGWKSPFLGHLRYLGSTYCSIQCMFHIPRSNPIQ